MPRMLLLAVDDNLNDTLLGCGCVVATVLVATTGAHAGNGDVGLALRQAVTLELLNELKKLHTTDVVGHTP